MKNSERYLAQAETVMRLAARAENSAEREVYLGIAEGWRKLAAEVSRKRPTQEAHGPVDAETRTFRPDEC